MTKLFMQIRILSPKSKIYFTNTDLVQKPTAQGIVSPFYHIASSTLIFLPFWGCCWGRREPSHSITWQQS